MKKLVAISSIFFLSVSISQAQTNFGLKAGYNASKVQIANSSDFNSKSGLHIGGLAHIHVSEHFAIQPELVYSMQGGESPNSTLKLNYLNVPVLAQYMVNDGLRLQTGPQVGFLASAKQKSGNLEVDVADNYDAVDFSWAFGAGYIFPAGFGIDARYNLGLNDISDNSSFEAKNRVFQVGLFYQFHNKTGKHK